MEINSSIPVKGMNLDSITSQKGDGIYSLMFNGLTESDDHKYTATNEAANIKLVNLPDGYFLIGYVRIRSTRIIVFLVNPEENKSEIGYFDYVENPDLNSQLTSATTLAEAASILSSTQGTYNKLAYSTESNTAKKVSVSTANDYFSNVTNNDPALNYPSPSGSIEANTAITPYVVANCLNFKINHPIFHAVYKPNICDDRIYWTDGFNPPRYLIIDNIEGTDPSISNLQRVTANEGTPYCPPTEFLNELDCGKIRVFSLIDQPTITISDIDENGSLMVGSYQFAVAYTDKTNNRVSRFFDITNPVIITEDSYSQPFDTVQGAPYDIISNKSIRLKLSNFDSKYTYYQLAIIENLNGSKNIYQLGPYPTDKTDFIYTGNEQQKQRLSFDEFYQQRPVYEKADIMSTVGDKLLIGGLSTNPLANLQRIANKIKLKWQSVAVPYLLPEYSYKGGAFTANYRGYMRGEVYPFGIVFEFEDGTNSPVYHIPGRQSTFNDITPISSENKDVISNDPCVTTTSLPKWQVYDTSTIDGTFTEYDDLVNGNLISTNTNQFTVIETATETFDVKPDLLTTFKVRQDNSTIINDSDGKFLTLVLPDGNESTIKLIKGGSTSGNKVEVRLRYKTKSSILFVGTYRDIVTTTNYDTLQEIFNADVISDLTNEIVGFDCKISYATTTTNNSGYGSEYVSFALEKLFSILTQGNITYNNKKYLDQPFVSSYLNPVGDNTAVDYIKEYNVFSRFTSFYWNTTGTFLIEVSKSYGTKSYVEQAISNIVAKYSNTTANYITNDVIKGLLASTKYISHTLENSVYSDVNVVSTLSQNNAGSVEQFDVWTGYVTVTTTWNIIVNSITASPQLLKKTLQCEKIPHAYGKFAYWESIERYPCDDAVWGQSDNPSLPYYDPDGLSGKPIRHHKFPTTSTISHFNTLKGLGSFYDDIDEDIAFIYPIGVNVDHASVVNAFVEALKDPANFPNITEEQLSKIKGYKIVRGNRVNDASIVAKGLLYDVWKHTKKLGKDYSKTFYYSNYPYNDLRPDPYIQTGDGHYTITSRDRQDNYVSTHLITHPYYDKNTNKASKNDRYTFLSPETLFAKPKIDGYLVLDQEMSGVSYGHFVPVLDHAKYQRLRDPGYGFSFVLANAISLISSLQIGTSTKIDLTSYVGNIIPNRDSIRNLMKLGIPLTNLAYQYTSVGFYNSFTPITTYGNTRRRIDIIQHLRKDIESVGDNYAFNNIDREHSLYLKLNDTLPSTSTEDTSRVKRTDEPSKIITSVISSYYASIKRDLPDQYGLISTVQYCFTGIKYKFDQIALQGAIQTSITGEVPSYTNSEIYGIVTFGAGQEKDTIFGGDIFIGRFAVKRKHNYFLGGMRGFPNNTDINYSDLANVGYPTYFFDSIPKLKVEDESETEYDNQKQFDSYAATSINDSNAGTDDSSSGKTSGLRNSFKKAALALKNIFKVLQNKPNDYLDLPTLTGKTLLGQYGQMYLHSYGVPYFFVESIINVDLRHRGTNSWEDFYPHTEPSIPDTWLQEDIKKDEYFGYNRDFSAQNTDNPLLPLQLTYNPLKDCFDYLPNRVAYSQAANFEDIVDNYLLFRVNDYADFGYDYGYLKNVAFLPNQKIITQFQNGSKLYSSYSTIQPSNSTKPIYLGSSELFQQGIVLADSEVGYAGNQNRAFILTEMGAVWVDAQRGAVFLLTDGISEISLNNKSWFKSNLPFNIIKDFPYVHTDNPFHNLNPVGITMAYDNKYQRVLITKHDYKLKRPAEINIQYDPSTQKFFTDDQQEISLKNTDYFINKSWTISYSFLNKEWISFHSYTPNTYISLNQRFLSTNIDGSTQSVWTHNQTNKAYQIVYGNLVPFILEFPYYYKGSTEILGSVLMYSESLLYSGQDDYYQNLSEFFNKCIIWNKYQTTGLLNLIWDDPNNDTLAIDYPQYNNSDIDILYSSKDDYYTFNHIWNVLNSTKAVWTESVTSPIIKNLNVSQQEYQKPQDEMDRMRGKETFIRMIQDSKWKIKYKVYLQANKTNTSIY